MFIDDDNNPTTTSTIDDNPTTSITTTADDDKSEMPTTQKEELIKFKMTLSNVTKSNVNEIEKIIKSIKKVLIKIYKAEEMIISESEITINRINNNKRLLVDDDDNVIMFEIFIEIPHIYSVDKMYYTIQSKTSEYFKNELIIEDFEIFQYIGIEMIVQPNNESKTAVMNILLFYSILFLSIMII